MLNVFRYVILLLFISYGLADSGLFWHVTDFHLDPQYSENGDPNKKCHQNVSSGPGRSIGKFGNSWCDSPHVLVHSAIEEMAHIQGNPHFILWTGDNTPHETVEWTALFSSLANITTQLTNAFPVSDILPAIGNHDTYPPNQLVDGPNQTVLYRRYLEEGGWGHLTPLQNPAAKETFRRGGYYRAEPLHGANSVTVLVLNTILWYHSNPSVVGLEDPAGQLEWLKKELNEARNGGKMVYLAGHVAPGVESGKFTRYLPKFERRYLDLVREYRAHIAGQFFGHQHRDTYRLFTDSNSGEVYGSLLMASSITPWGDPKWPSVNPTIRLVKFDASNFRPLDFTQFYLDLEQANRQNLAKWDKLYQFTELYDKIPDLSTESLENLLASLKQSEPLRQRFLQMELGGKPIPDSQNTLRLLCDLSQIEIAGYQRCVSSCVQHPSECPTSREFLRIAGPSGPHPFFPNRFGTIHLVLILAASACVIGLTYYLGSRKLRKLRNQQHFEYRNF